MCSLLLQELDEIQTYPAEILQQQLYLGNWQHGNAEIIQKELRIGGHVNCCEHPGTV
jgi:serine/threonine/tyrosine-interacting-like protein 1